MAFTPSLTWADKELVTHTKMNTMTGNDDDLDTRVKKCLLAGANTTGHTRLASGEKAGSLSAASAANITITFATDCKLGDPSFDEAPIITASLEVTSGYDQLIVLVNSHSDTGFTARVVTADGTNQTSVFKVHFHAVGAED